jgi:hypothetical protein
MSDHCRTCGKEGTRIDAPFYINQDEFTDSYCGWCGVKWGSFVEAVAEAAHPRRRKPRLVKVDHGFSRFGQR